eukprot:CAMPEP_0170762892 /NCGR_PEP_ID=MMETSP0733-20121128/3042_1 /TAXON_ID=186038 /ORGANISM="Fragilariopsis kerguelensis, Strain L26-C5" /LENGTH=73 /DNA_ID=CAMNT_0011103163 /DNA_START=203 /DNA_END=421 /DNA_ORIENTATION=-
MHAVVGNLHQEFKSSSATLQPNQSASAAGSASASAWWNGMTTITKTTYKIVRMYDNDSNKEAEDDNDNDDDDD